MNTFYVHANKSSSNNSNGNYNNNRPPPPPPPPQPLPLRKMQQEEKDDIYDDILPPIYDDNDDIDDDDGYPNLNYNRRSKRKSRDFDFNNEVENDGDYNIDRRSDDYRRRDDVGVVNRSLPRSDYYEDRQMGNGRSRIRRKNNDYDDNDEEEEEEEGEGKEKEDTFHFDQYDYEYDTNRRGSKRKQQDYSYPNDNDKRPIRRPSQNDNPRMDKKGDWNYNQNDNVQKRNIDNTKKEQKQQRSFFSSPFKRLGQGKIDTDRDNVIPNRSKRTNPFERRDDSAENDNNNNDDDEHKSTTTYNPIDYQFPSLDIASKQKNDERGKNDDDISLPETGWKRDNDIRDNDIDNDPQSSSARRNNFANPRKDAIAHYTSTKMGKMKLALSYTTCGGLFGTFLGKSIVGHGKQSAIIFAFLFWFIGTFLRDAYGEMVRSVALAFIFLLNRTRSVRRRYRTGIHLKSICRLGGGGRAPFPPITGEDGIENMWKYVPQYNDDPEFDMIKSLICLVVIGSFCGGNIPLIPTWIGSMAGAATFAFMGISKNARGDLMRTMGMRVVALAGEAIDINAELKIARKVSVVAGKLLDKALILDRKHRIKDKLVSGASWVYDKVSATVSNVQNDMNQEEDEVNPDRRRRRNANAKEA